MVKWIGSTTQMWASGLNASILQTMLANGNYGFSAVSKRLCRAVVSRKLLLKEEPRLMSDFEKALLFFPDALHRLEVKRYLGKTR